MEGRGVPVAGRLGVAAAGPVVGLVDFLFWPGVVEAGRLGLVADSGLAFSAAGFADGVDAEGFTFDKKQHPMENTKQTKKENSSL